MRMPPVVEHDTRTVVKFMKENPTILTALVLPTVVPELRSQLQSFIHCFVAKEFGNGGQESVHHLIQKLQRSDLLGTQKKRLDCRRF